MIAILFHVCFRPHEDETSMETIFEKTTYYILKTPAMKSTWKFINVSEPIA